MSQPPRPGQPNPNFDRAGTLIETEQEVIQAFLASARGLSPVPASPAPAAPSHPAPPPMPAAAPPPQPVAARTASPFRPTVRPPVPSADRLRRRQDRRRGHPHPRYLGSSSAAPRGTSESRSTAGSRRGTSRSRTRSSAACTAGSSPTSRARTGCSSGSAGRSWPTRPSSSSATGDTGSMPRRPTRARRPTTPERAGSRRDPGVGRRPQPVPAAGPDRADRQGDRQPDAPGQARILDRHRPDLPDLPARRPVLRAAARPAVSRPRGAGTPSTTRRRNGLWLRMSQIIGRIDGPVPDRRAAVPAQVALTVHRTNPRSRPCRDAF